MIIDPNNAILRADQFCYTLPDPGTKGRPRVAIRIYPYRSDGELLTRCGGSVAKVAVDPTNEEAMVNAISIADYIVGLLNQKRLYRGPGRFVVDENFEAKFAKVQDDCEKIERLRQLEKNKDSFYATRSRRKVRRSSVSGPW